MSRFQYFLGITTHVLMLILYTTASFSDDVQVAAAISPRHIQYNEKATLELTISGNTQMKYIGTPSFDFLPDFLVVPLHSKTNTYLVDNKLAVKMAWFYELIPQKVGKIALSDIQFLYQGVPYITNPGAIIVSAVDTYRHTLTGGIHKIEAKINNSKPYLNEPIEYEFRYLYTTVLPTMEPIMPVLPEFPEFIVEEQPEQEGITETINGITYQVQKYLRLLYPRETGRVLINPAQLKLPIKDHPKTLKTKTLALTVQPLPELGKPANFTGAVGDYEVTTQVDRNRLEIRKALTLSLTISGKGNLKTVKPPKISSVSGFRVEQPIQVESKTLQSSVYTYVFMPLRSGFLQIPEIEFVFFNPKTHSYQISKTDPINITAVANPIRIVSKDSTFQSWLLALTVIPILAGIILAIFFLYRVKLKPSRVITQVDTVTPAQKAFTALESLREGNFETNSTTYEEALTRILYQYLGDREGLTYRKLTTTEIQAICQKAKIPVRIQKEFLDILSKCDYHRFSPVLMSSEERKSLISRADLIIHHFEGSE